eukprot:m.63849 g.63849  ORF g.63849 m.63849 type:complete len:728 (+) comp23350_c0_seq1:396-2579(+)
MAALPTLRAIYDSVGDDTTPAFEKDSLLILIKKHDSGWLEVQTPAGVIGYVSPSWVEEIVTPPTGVSTPGTLDLDDVAPLDPSPSEHVDQPDADESVEKRTRAPSRGVLSSRVSVDFSSQLAAKIAVSSKPPGFGPPTVPRKKGPPPAVKKKSVTHAGPPPTRAKTNPPAPPTRGSAVTPKSAPTTTPKPTTQEPIPTPSPVVIPAPVPAPAPVPVSVPTLPTVLPDPVVNDDGGDAGGGGDDNGHHHDGDATNDELRKKPARAAPPPPPPKTSTTAMPPPTPTMDVPTPVVDAVPSPVDVPQPVVPVAVHHPTHEPPPVIVASLPQAERPIGRCEGLLERKTVLEAGKEPKKKVWQVVYAVLVGPTMYFYKDSKSKNSGKKPLSFVQVNDKSLEQPTISEKRKDYAFMLGNASDRFLFNAPDNAARTTWITALSKSQSPGLTGETGSMVPVDDVPKQPVAAPTVPLQKRVGNNKMESSQSGRKKWGGIRSTLNKYLNSRPAKEELVERGIITEAVFGGFIIEQVASEAHGFPDRIEAPNVPQVVVQCVKYMDEFLTETGIYRVNGNASQMQKLAAQCNEDVFSVDIAGQKDLHVVSGLLKLYFRELQEPLFTDEAYDQFVEYAKLQDKTQRCNLLKNLVQCLPTEHRTTLHFLCKHMLRVVAEATSNKMRMNNMAIVFGPTLLRKSQPTMDNIIKDSPFQSSVIEDIMSQLDWFMDGEPPQTNPVE